MLLCEPTKNYVLTPIWQVALFTHLRFGASEDVPLDQYSQLLRALFRRLLFERRSALVPAFYDDGTKFLREKFQTAQEPWLHKVK